MTQCRTLRKVAVDRGERALWTNCMRRAARGLSGVARRALLERCVWPFIASIATRWQLDALTSGLLDTTQRHCNARRGGARSVLAAESTHRGIGVQASRIVKRPSRRVRAPMGGLCREISLGRGTLAGPARKVARPRPVRGRAPHLGAARPRAQAGFYGVNRGCASLRWHHAMALERPLCDAGVAPCRLCR